MIEKGAHAAQVATYGGASAAVIFGLSAQDFAALAGVAIGICGLLVQIWFAHKRIKLMEQQQR